MYQTGAISDIEFTQSLMGITRSEAKKIVEQRKKDGNSIFQSQEFDTRIDKRDKDNNQNPTNKIEKVGD